MAELNLRARKILNAVVQEYLGRGDAVGSRTITRRYGIGLSAATVRNVMADLEELGLLRQPHASAGRVPTTQGLRFFIDSLLKVRALSIGEKEEIRSRYGLPDADLDGILQRTSRVLSEMSRQATIVIAPVAERQRLEHIEFVRLPQGELLVVLVVEGGKVHNKIVTASGLPSDSSFLVRVNNYLNGLVAGLTLEEVRQRVLAELGQEKNQVDELASRALKLGEAAVRPEGMPGVIVSGQAHLLDMGDDREYLQRARALLVALEEKERIVKLVDRTLEGEGIQVWLGAETPFAEFSDLSIVASSYGSEERPVGLIAVIGPARVNYSRVIPLVDFTAELLSQVLGQRR
ncbi:MAG: heat-inducible transcriptional repressor HrcA [Pseudomonadota bacterium]